MSNVDISYGELILIDTFDAGAGIVGAAQAAVAYAIQKDTHGHQPLVAISAETFYFSNNLSVGGQIDLSGELQRGADSMMTHVQTITPDSNQDIGAQNNESWMVITFLNSFTAEGIDHGTSGSLFANTNDGMTHLRLNIELGADTMETATRHYFVCYVYTYYGSSSITTPGSFLRKYYVDGGYARAQTVDNDKFRIGGNIDLYLNKNTQFEIVVKKLYGDKADGMIRSVILSPVNSQLIIEKIH